MERFLGICPPADFGMVRHPSRTPILPPPPSLPPVLPCTYALPSSRTSIFLSPRSIRPPSSIPPYYASPACVYACMSDCLRAPCACPPPPRLAPPSPPSRTPPPASPLLAPLLPRLPLSLRGTYTLRTSFCMHGCVHCLWSLASVGTNY